MKKFFTLNFVLFFYEHDYFGLRIVLQIESLSEEKIDLVIIRHQTYKICTLVLEYLIIFASFITAIFISLNPVSVGYCPSLPISITRGVLVTEVSNPDFIILNTLYVKFASSLLKISINFITRLIAFRFYSSLS
jgi:hypothetical protein